MLTTGTIPVTAVPLTMAAWFYIDSLTITADIMCLADASQTDEMFNLMAHTTADKVRARSEATAGSAIADSSTAYSLNTWHHACAVNAAVDDRKSYIDSDWCMGELKLASDQSEGRIAMLLIEGANVPIQQSSRSFLPATTRQERRLAALLLLEEEGG